MDSLQTKGETMKPILMFLLALFGACNVPGQSALSGDVRLEGHLNCPAVSTHGGRVYLRLCLSGRHAHHWQERRPLNLCVVLDRSGSMSEESKIAYAKSALLALVDQLRSEDRFSLVIYDDEVDVLRPSMRVGNSKDEIRSVIQEITPRGWTNLGGGMQEGFRQVGKNLGEEYVNRVILLSDGLANQGITDPDQLQRIARRQRAESISLTTIGVGLDYNENLMVGLSESGGGNYYFLESSRNLASVFRKEFDGMSEVVAQNVLLQLNLGHGVSLIDAIGYGFREEGNSVQIALGDVYADESREIILELNVAPGSGELALADAKLMRSDGGELGGVESKVRYESDHQSVERQRDMAEQAKVDIALSTRGVAKAMEALDKGDRDGASRTLSETQRALANSPAAVVSGVAGSAIEDQVKKIGGYAKTLSADSVDAKRAKKEIQFENYRQQKNK